MPVGYLVQLALTLHCSFNDRLYSTVEAICPVCVLTQRIKAKSLTLQTAVFAEPDFSTFERHRRLHTDFVPRFERKRLVTSVEMPHGGKSFCFALSGSGES